jgi:hypothetical protein
MTVALRPHRNDVVPCHELEASEGVHEPAQLVHGDEPVGEREARIKLMEAPTWGEVPAEALVIGPLP